MQMQFTALATLAALFTYSWMIRNVGRLRMKLGIKAPEMNGPPEFLNAQRVQANTVEQMLLFLPSLWMCAFFLGDRWAAAAGAFWVLGRVLYALAYYQDPSKRGVGFIISLVASILLMIGTVVGMYLH